MGNTADLAMVQKTNIDTFTKRVSHRGALLKGGCSQSAVSKHVKWKVDWKEEKCAQATGMSARLRIQSSKAD